MAAFLIVYLECICIYITEKEGDFMYVIATFDKRRCVAIADRLEDIMESAERVRAIERAKPKARRVAYAGYQRTPDGYMRRLEGELRLIV